MRKVKFTALILALSMTAAVFFGCNSSPKELEVTPQEVSKYHEYFYKDNCFSMLFEHEDGAGEFTDDEICAYTIGVAIFQMDGYDFDKGISKAHFDKITEKYFGKTVSNYENSKTTVLESGNIVATGWGPTSLDMILTKLTRTAKNTYDATFNMTGAPMFETQAETDTYRNNLLNGEYDEDYQPTVVNMQFQELKDEYGDMYIKFISITVEESDEPAPVSPVNIHSVQRYSNGGGDFEERTNLSEDVQVTLSDIVKKYFANSTSSTQTIAVDTIDEYYIIKVKYANVTPHNLYSSFFVYINPQTGSACIQITRRGVSSDLYLSDYKSVAGLFYDK